MKNKLKECLKKWIEEIMGSSVCVRTCVVCMCTSNILSELKNKREKK